MLEKFLLKLLKIENMCVYDHCDYGFKIILSFRGSEILVYNM